MLVRDLKKANRKAVNSIKNYPSQKPSNLFFDNVLTSARVADPERMIVEES